MIEATFPESAAGSAQCLPKCHSTWSGQRTKTRWKTWVGVEQETREAPSSGGRCRRQRPKRTRGCFGWNPEE